MFISKKKYENLKTQNKELMEKYFNLKRVCESEFNTQSVIIALLKQMPNQRAMIELKDLENFKEQVMTSTNVINNKIELRVEKI